MLLFQTRYFCLLHLELELEEGRFAKEHREATRLRSTRFVGDEKYFGNFKSVYENSLSKYHFHFLMSSRMYDSFERSKRRSKSFSHQTFLYQAPNSIYSSRHLHRLLVPFSVTAVNPFCAFSIVISATNIWG